ncbi:hypothetical protein LPJ74_005353 [Coemansia sp. RSA 1843]|nr:hypothetical protein LPJ74_005353 [Coemansia sp. RSA 1843]
MQEWDGMPKIVYHQGVNGTHGYWGPEGMYPFDNVVMRFGEKDEYQAYGTMFINDTVVNGLHPYVFIGNDTLIDGWMVIGNDTTALNNVQYADRICVAAAVVLAVVAAAHAAAAVAIAVIVATVAAATAAAVNVATAVAIAAVASHVAAVANHAAANRAAASAATAVSRAVDVVSSNAAVVKAAAKAAAKKAEVRATKKATKRVGPKAVSTANTAKGQEKMAVLLVRKAMGDLARLHHHHHHLLNRHSCPINHRHQKHQHPLIHHLLHLALYHLWNPRLLCVQQSQDLTR